MILVVGATGSLGSKIVHRLLESREAVRVLARASSDYVPLQQAGADVAFGDLTEPLSLERACDGVDAVITTASASKRTSDTIEDVDLRGNLNLINAAKRAGVRHFVLISALGASEDSPVPVFRAKAAAEHHLRNSGMVYTILEATAFMDVWFSMLIEQAAFSGQPVTLVGESRRRHSFVAERDVAAFAVAALRNAAANNATLVIGGPEPITFRDVVRAYEAATGREIPIRSVAPGEPIPGTPEIVWGLAAALESHETIVPMEETADSFGVALTNVRDFARSRVAAPTPRAG